MSGLKQREGAWPAVVAAEVLVVVGSDRYDVVVDAVAVVQAGKNTDPEGSDRDGIAAVGVVCRLYDVVVTVLHRIALIHVFDAAGFHGKLKKLAHYRWIGESDAKELRCIPHSLVHNQNLVHSLWELGKREHAYMSEGRCCKTE